jgi:hypothetical protein
MTEQINLFETASRQKLRFTTAKGLLPTEDLWDLPLTTLNELAKSLSKQVKEAGEESFIEVKSSANEKLETMFEIVKHIIKVKLAERETLKVAKENATKKAQILELIHQKKNESLASMPVEELEKMLTKL